MKSNDLKIKLFKIIYILLIIFLYHLSILISLKDTFRILVYTVCDLQYSHYIPIFCDCILKIDKLNVIDIEIGVNVSKLTDNEEKALNFLRKYYPKSKIIIDYNVFIKNNSGTFYNGYKVHIGSIRYLSKPILRNKYIYITDIDIFVMEENFYLYLINDMNKRNSFYSNIVRKKNILFLLY